MKLYERIPLPAALIFDERMFPLGTRNALALQKRLIQENGLSLATVVLSTVVAWVVFGFHWLTVACFIMSLSQINDTRNQITASKEKLKWLPGVELPFIGISNWLALTVSPTLGTVYDSAKGLVYVPSREAIRQYEENDFCETADYMGDKWYTMTWNRVVMGDPCDDPLTVENIRAFESQMFFRVFIGCLWTVAIVIYLA